MNASSTASAAWRGGVPYTLLSGKRAVLFHCLAAVALIAAPLGLSNSLAQGQEDPALIDAAGAVDAEGIETLTHGPIHEAFAAPTGTDPVPGPVIAKQPPANIEEEPPALKAEGAIWIPGYWEFDDEMKDFIWISGNWRVPPPGMRWVPSYWVEAEGGWQRVPGFWVSADAGELEYRETPPESLEAGPSGPAPAEDQFWIPGTWNYYETGYRWRPGYWSPYQSNWVWCPARWVWTPGGCIYVAGYWDHRLAYRGHLFAPVYFRTAVYMQPGWRYRPWCVVPSHNLFVHMWYRPRWNCYYFGNYYGSRYNDWIPWYRCGWGDHRRYYDPLVSWCRTHYRRQGIDYIDRVDRWHNHFARNADLRPPRTWREQVNLVARADVDVRDSQRILAADLRDLARRDDLPVRLTRIDQRQQEVLKDAADQIRDLRGERRRVEADVKAHVAARVPVGDERPGSARSIGDQARLDAKARVDALKLRLPKVDTDVAARVDAAIGDRTDRTRDVPAAADPGPGDRTGRVDGREPGDTSAARNALRDLRDRGVLSDAEPRNPRDGLPRIETPEVAPTELPKTDTPPVDVPPRTPRVEVPDRTPDEAPDRTPRIDSPRTPRLEVPDPTPPAETPELTPRTPRVVVPDRTPPAETPELTPRRGIPSTERPEAPRIGDPRVKPRAETPELTPRLGIPSTERPEAPRTGPPLTRPRAETPELTPRVGVPSTSRPLAPRADRTPRAVPRVDVPDASPRIDTPRISPRIDTSPRVDIPRSTPRVDVPRVSPRIEAPRIDTTPRATPRVDVPRISPRLEVPRSAPRIDVSPRSAPRIDVPRASGSSRAAEAMRARDRARDRD